MLRNEKAAEVFIISIEVAGVCSGEKDFELRL